jgi:hypothetical protein
LVNFNGPIRSYYDSSRRRAQLIDEILILELISMASRSEREKSKMQERYQMILSQMLKEEDNKYCVDCDTKSKDRN